MRQRQPPAVLQWAHEVGRGLLDLLYPPRCAGCGQTGALYCLSCRRSVPLVVPPLCSLCGQPHVPSGLCSRCARDPLHIDGIRSVAIFAGSLRKAIHRLKYDYVRDLAVPLGEMLVSFWQETPLPADVIVPVPLHPRRVRERGYNQAALLAEQLAQVTGIPMVRDVLLRHKYTVSQTKLDAEQRRQNVDGAFTCVGSEVRGKRVLLMDDVCTTGATLEASSVALKAGGAQSVWALTLARPSVQYDSVQVGS